MSLRNGRIFVPAVIQGQDVVALLDSGAEMTLLDSAFAQTLDIAGGQTVEGRGSGAGTVEAQLLQGVRLQAINRDLGEHTVAAIDLTDVSARLVGEPLKAILGRELFDQERIRLDFQAGEVCIVPRAAEPPGELYPLETEHGIETFPIAVEGHPVQAEFDLGSAGGLMLSEAVAGQLGMLDGSRPVTLEKGGGIGGEVERKVVMVNRVDIGALTLSSITASIDPSDHAGQGNVGLTLLHSFLVTVDYSEKKLWLAPR